jgi:tRNA uridine 5-carbamoylmethylation protein Kti12
VVNNESLGVVRGDAYASPSAEKICRGNMKAAVERGCTKDSVLISDDLNYIKVGQIDCSTIQTFPYGFEP